MHFFRFLSLILALAFFSPANSADFSALGFQEDDALCPRFGVSFCTAFIMEGSIEPGDSEWLSGKLSEMADVSGLSGRIGYVYLNSTGGDVYEAMRLGRIFREHKIQAIVAKDGHCYSACVLVLAGAVARLSPGEVGVHSFYSEGMKLSGFDYKNEDEKYEKVRSDVRGYLDEMRITSVVLDEMVNTPPSTLHVLSMDEKERYGLFGWDPVFHQKLVNQGYVGGKK